MILLQQKRIFDRQIADLTEKEEINFSAGEDGLPSRSLERKRWEDYVAQSVGNADHPKLNPVGCVRILGHIGVLEKTVITE